MNSYIRKTVLIRWIRSNRKAFAIHGWCITNKGIFRAFLQRIKARKFRIMVKIEQMSLLKRFFPTDKYARISNYGKKMCRCPFFNFFFIPQSQRTGYLLLVWKNIKMTGMCTIFTGFRNYPRFSPACFARRKVRKISKTLQNRAHASH